MFRRSKISFRPPQLSPFAAIHFRSGRCLLSKYLRLLIFAALGFRVPRISQLPGFVTLDLRSAGLRASDSATFDIRSPRRPLTPIFAVLDIRSSLFKIYASRFRSELNIGWVLCIQYITNGSQSRSLQTVIPVPFLPSPSSMVNPKTNR